MIKYYLAPSVHPSIVLCFERKTIGASGYDLMANIGMERTIKAASCESMNPGIWVGHTGLHLSMPIGVEAQVRTRSGLCRDHGIVVANAPGTVDSDYRGEICVTLMNLGKDPYVITPGDRIAQLVFQAVLVPGIDLSEFVDARETTPQRVFSLEELGFTDRGASGHGSTGR